MKRAVSMSSSSPDLVLLDARYSSEMVLNIGGGGARCVTRQPLLAGFQELLRPIVDRRRIVCRLRRLHVTVRFDDISVAYAEDRRQPRLCLDRRISISALKAAEVLLADANTASATDRVNREKDAQPCLGGGYPSFLITL